MIVRMEMTTELRLPSCRKFTFVSYEVSLTKQCSSI